MYGRHKIELSNQGIKIDADDNADKFWGFDGSISRLENITEIQKLEIKYSIKKISIPDSALDYLFERAGADFYCFHFILFKFV